MISCQEEKMVLEWSGLGMTLPKNSVLQIKNTQDLEKIKVFQIGKGRGNIQSVMWSRNASWDQSRVIIEWVKIELSAMKTQQPEFIPLGPHGSQVQCCASVSPARLCKVEAGDGLQGSSCLKTKGKKRTNSQKKLFSDVTCILSAP